MQVGPDGALYYADIVDGTIQRISYPGGQPLADRARHGDARPRPDAADRAVQRHDVDAIPTTTR